MNEILVDTDVVSYLLNRHTLAPAFEKLLIGRTPLISFITVAELYRGALSRFSSSASSGWAARYSASSSYGLAISPTAILKFGRI